MCIKGEFKRGFQNPVQHKSGKNKYTCAHGATISNNVIQEREGSLHPRSWVLNLTSAFPSSFLPFPSAPQPQNASLSEFWISSVNIVEMG